MPSYQFECSKCGYQETKRLSIANRNNNQYCPQCFCKLDRLISTGSGIIFKGKGFYETDYKRKDK